MNLAGFSIVFFLINRYCSGKYIEGVLKSSENWVFLARFCFLSEDGQFEYLIEYNENQGDLHLLLYYDDDNQWPAIYKSNKTCKERESILNIQRNQIVKLTVESNLFSECQYIDNNKELPNKNIAPSSTSAPLYTINIPTPKTRNRKHNRGKVKINQTTPTTTGNTPTIPFIHQQYDMETSDYSRIETTTIINSTLPTDTTSTSENPKTSTQTTQLHSSFLPPAPMRSKRSIQQNRIIKCHSSRRFRSARERWWFIAISNCNNGNKGININYQLLMTNGATGDYWHEHFSADEFYILPVLVAFGVAYTILFLIIIICSAKLKQRQLLHSTYKLFALSCVLQLFGIFILSMVYLKMAVSGRETPKFKRFGNILIGASETCFLLVLLLLAKGYTVTRGRLSLKSTVKVTIFMCIYVTTYVSIFIYEASVFDPGEVLYLYESPAGYALITLKLIAWVMFMYSTIATLKKYPEKANFYYPFNLVGTIGFIAGPAFIISANNYIDKWVRESVVCAVLHFIAFSGHLMFLILTMPSVANKNFPYHVRTTQIGIMEIDGGNCSAGTSTIEQFGHHVYEPSNTAGLSSNGTVTIGLREQTVIIPLTRRTEEFCQNLYENRKRSHSENSDDEVKSPRYTEEEIARENSKMENILKWSLGTRPTNEKINLFDLLNFEQKQLASKQRERNRTAIEKEEDNKSFFEDKEYGTASENHCVPIELFTVSKSVQNKQTDDMTKKKT